MNNLREKFREFLKESPYFIGEYDNKYIIERGKVLKIIDSVLGEEK